MFANLFGIYCIISFLLAFYVANRNLVLLQQYPVAEREARVNDSIVSTILMMPLVNLYLLAVMLISLVLCIIVLTQPAEVAA